MWQLHDITTELRENPKDQLDSDKLADIRRNEHLLITSLEKFFTDESNSDELRFHCYLKLLDIMTLFSAKLKRTALRVLAYDSGAHLQSKIKQYFDNEMKKPIDHSDDEEVEKGLEHKRKILTGTSRAVACFALPQVEFGPSILLNFLVHDDKKMDNIIKLFFGTIRKQNASGIESKLVYKAITAKYDFALEKGTESAMHAYKEFATKLGSVFPHRKIDCQDTLQNSLQATFLDALRDFPERQSMLDGLTMFASKVFPNRASRM